MSRNVPQWAVGLAFAFQLGRAQEKESVAVIAEANGVWRLEGRSVHMSQQLAAGAVIKFDSPTGRIRSSLRIYYLQGRTVDCMPPACLQITVEAPANRVPPQLERVFRAIEAALRNQGDFAVPRVRSTGWRDGIGMVSGNALEFPFLSGVSQSAVTALQVRPLNGSGDVGDPVGQPLPWIPSKSPPRWPRRSLPLGLYRVNVLNKEARPSGEFFIVAIVDRQRYHDLQQQLELIVESTSSWMTTETNLQEMLVRLYLREASKER